MEIKDTKNFALGKKVIRLNQLENDNIALKLDLGTLGKQRKL
jgi:hypothetical protein